MSSNSNSNSKTPQYDVRIDWEHVSYRAGNDLDVYLFIPFEGVDDEWYRLWRDTLDRVVADWECQDHGRLWDNCYFEETRISLEGVWPEATAPEVRTCLDALVERATRETAFRWEQGDQIPEPRPLEEPSTLGYMEELVRALPVREAKISNEDMSLAERMFPAMMEAVVLALNGMNDDELDEETRGRMADVGDVSLEATVFESGRTTVFVGGPNEEEVLAVLKDFVNEEEPMGSTPLLQPPRPQQPAGKPQEPPAERPDPSMDELIAACHDVARFGNEIGQRERDGFYDTDDEMQGANDHEVFWDYVKRVRSIVWRMWPDVLDATKFMDPYAPRGESTPTGPPTPPGGPLPTHPADADEPAPPNAPVIAPPVPPVPQHSEPQVFSEQEARLIQEWDGGDPDELLDHEVSIREDGGELADNLFMSKQEAFGKGMDVAYMRCQAELAETGTLRPTF